MGLVETGVGLVPAGGGCKEVLWRWSQTPEAKEDPDFAPLKVCLLYTSPSPRDVEESRMPSSA